MHCLAYCLIGAALLGAMIGVMIDKNSPSEQAFLASLDTNQQATYAQIYKERLTVYIQGLGLGIVLAIAYYMTASAGYSLTINACIITAIVLGTSYLYYMIRPKTMMLKSLNNVNQVQLYTDLYRQYQYRSYLGMTLGIGAFFCIAYGASLYQK